MWSILFIFKHHQLCALGLWWITEDVGEIVNFLSCDMWKLEEWITELIEINVGSRTQTYADLNL